MIRVIGFVWVAELFNTAIERIIDFISTERQAPIRFIKDRSAGVVLKAAIAAFITGCIVFIPKLQDDLFKIISAGNRSVYTTIYD